MVVKTQIERKLLQISKDDEMMEHSLNSEQ